jgi:hypothetical protein
VLAVAVGSPVLGIEAGAGAVDGVRQLIPGLTLHLDIPRREEGDRATADHRHCTGQASVAGAKRGVGSVGYLVKGVEGRRGGHVGLVIPCLNCYHDRDSFLSEGVLRGQVVFLAVAHLAFLMSAFK